jgi:peptidoglycan hydrolase-like protein with peptidoglycan-binding domain
LPNLTPSTTYHYQVKAKDIYGNIGFYTDQTFTILTEGGVEIPVIGKPISEMTLEELKAEIARIIASIAKLQAELLKLKGCTITSFDRNLKQGNIGDDVKCLQIILNFSAATRVATVGAGAPGYETNYFGLLTKAAVIKFQEKYTSEILAPWGFTTGTGFVGTTTRAKLNTFLGR